MRRFALFTAVFALAGCPTPVGTEGLQGPQGPQGAKGDPGATGPQGSAGQEGAPGAAGQAGATGPMGTQGPAGPQGLQGAQGAVLVLDGGVVVGPAGSSVVVTPITAGGMPCPTGGIRVTQLSDGGITTLCNGAQGPAGPTGPTGAAGASVSTTTLAVLSPQCPTGGLLIGYPDGGASAICNGALGSTGPSGGVGPTGAMGATGATGGVGPAGPSGPAGPPGAAGPIGPMGPTGPAGAVLYLDGGVLLTNGTASSAPVQLLGYTTFTSNANLGGRTAANGRCSAEFPGTHLCNENEFRLARSAVPLAAAGAWLDNPSSAGNEPANSSYCSNFGASTAGWTTIVALPSGYSLTTSTTFSCASVLPMACCTSPSPKLRGYTTFVSNGNAGGRTVANGRCNTEFPGSHLCNENEFRLARSSIPLAAAAAWLDSPTSSGNEPANSSYCSNFGASTAGWTTIVALPTGYSLTTSTTFSCASVLPFTCCD